jgi:rhombotail lipoprotein
LNNLLRYLTLIIFFSSLIGCAGQQTSTKSSVVDYLYPNNAETSVTPSIPTLNLPLKVGIAFVPEQSSGYKGRNFWTGKPIDNSSLTSVNKAELLEKVANNFKELEFVNDIEVIPTEYLTPGGGFSNLDQIQTMYGIDVIALVSYDQVQFTDEGLLSLTYWTIVGAYVVSGEKNDTNTMLDTVVYDIKSRKMLFRAPGTSIVEGSATPVNLSEELRIDSLKGFNLAADEMVENLHIQLEKFKEKIKNKPEQVDIVHREGYSGGGGAINILTLILFGLYGFFRHKA